MLNEIGRDGCCMRFLFIEWVRGLVIQSVMILGFRFLFLPLMVDFISYEMLFLELAVLNLLFVLLSNLMIIKRMRQEEMTMDTTKVEEKFEMFFGTKRKRVFENIEMGVGGIIALVVTNGFSHILVKIAG